MWDLKACTVCLSTEINLHNMDGSVLRIDFNLVSGLDTHSRDGLPSYLCVECKAYVLRCKTFREKCQRANSVLQRILGQEDELTLDLIKEVNRESLDLLPTISFSDDRRAKYETVRYQKKGSSNRDSDHKSERHSERHSERRSERKSERHSKRHSDRKNDIMVEVPPKKKLKLCEKNIKVEVDDDILKQETVDVPPEEFEADQGFFGNSYFEDLPTHDDDDDHSDFGNDANDVNDENDGNDSEDANLKSMQFSDDKTVEGIPLDEEYGNMVPISLKEAKAAVDILNKYSPGKYRCKVCKRGHSNKERLEAHSRMHEKHLNGLFHCKLCLFYYRTEFLLKTHMMEKHMYKYVCSKCPEVCFERTTARKHHNTAHGTVRRTSTKREADESDAEAEPMLLQILMGDKKAVAVATHKAKAVKAKKKGKKLGKKKKAPPPKKKKRPIMARNLIKKVAISPLDQYRLVADRQNSRNYIAARYKCDFCYRGFREAVSYQNHMKKHDAAATGPFQCDICKLHFPTTRSVYGHMRKTHLWRYVCVKCPQFICYARGQAINHYKGHKNVTYKCDKCDLEFKKQSTRLTHMRIKHPSTDLCNICGHSFVSSNGLSFHQRKAHSREEIAAGHAQRVDKTSPLYCAECNIHFMSDAAFQVHLGSSSKHATVNISSQEDEIRRRRRQRGKVPITPRRKRAEPAGVVNCGVATGSDCEMCGVHLPNDVKARLHYTTEHPGAEYLKRYMCDVCGHTTRQYANLEVHMRTHSREKPYACTYCDRRFTMPSNRDRHLVVHTGEKKFECEICHRRFTQSASVKHHIQTVHLKIPYPPWDKKNRKRKKELEAAAAASSMPHPEPRMMLDATQDYIKSYINYEQTYNRL